MNEAVINVKSYVMHHGMFAITLLHLILSIYERAGRSNKALHLELPVLSLGFMTDTAIQVGKSKAPAVLAAVGIFPMTSS